MSNDGDYDNVRDIVNVAVDVLRDYGTACGDTRIERMARWITLNLAVELHDVRAGAMATITTDDTRVLALQVGDHVGFRCDDVTRSLRKETARQLAVALLICVERSENCQPWH